MPYNPPTQPTNLYISYQLYNKNIPTNYITTMYLSSYVNKHITTSYITLIYLSSNITKMKLLPINYYISTQVYDQKVISSYITTINLPSYIKIQLLAI